MNTKLKIVGLYVVAGGYMKSSARVIADSIINLSTKRLIEMQVEQNISWNKGQNPARVEYNIFCAKKIVVIAEETPLCRHSCKHFAL